MKFIQFSSVLVFETILHTAPMLMSRVSFYHAHFICCFPLVLFSIVDTLPCALDKHFLHMWVLVFLVWVIFNVVYCNERRWSHPVVSWMTSVPIDVYVWCCMASTHCCKCSIVVSWTVFRTWVYSSEQNRCKSLKVTALWFLLLWRYYLAIWLGFSASKFSNKH